MRKNNKTSNIPKNIRWSQGRYLFYTIESSKIGRQLAFSEGAIFWVLYISITSIDLKPKNLLIAFYMALIIFFIFDLLQYLIGSVRFDNLAENLKKIHKQNSNKNLNYQIGDEIGKSTRAFFIIKFTFLLISTLLLMAMFVMFIVL